MVTEVYVFPEWILWILIAVYLGMSALYAFDKYWEKNSLQEALFTLGLCVMLPVAGFVIVWMKDYYARKKDQKNLFEIFQDSSFFQDELKILRPMDMEKELNRVPMAEALLLNNYELRRKMVMDTLKEDDTIEYLSVLKDALENEDSETSHYASSIIMQLQADVQKRMIESEKIFDQNPENKEAAEKYERELYELITGGLLGTVNMRKYFLQYEHLCEHLLGTEKPEERYFLHRIRILFLEKNYTAVPEILERYLTLYPKSEDAVLCQIQLCINTRNYDGLKAFLGTLSSRPVILTQKTLEYIRFFRKGGKKS